LIANILLGFFSGEILVALDWLSAAVRSLATFPALAMLELRASVLECVQSSAAFAVNRPITVNPGWLRSDRPSPLLKGEAHLGIATVENSGHLES